jgi:cytoplasmic FMR1 interacting protein
LLKEADLNVSSTYGRIIIHSLSEISSDILPNYCYNNSTKRFVLTKFRINKEPKRQEPPIYQAHDLWGSKAIQIIYQAIHSLYSGFIGQHHFRCMNKYLGYHGIALIINEFLQMIQSSVS